MLAATTQPARQNQRPGITIDEGIADITLNTAGLNIQGGEWRGVYRNTGRVQFRNGLDQVTTVNGNTVRTPIQTNAFTFPPGGQSFTVDRVGDRAFVFTYQGPLQPNGSYQEYSISFEQGQRASLTQRLVTPSTK